MGVTGDDVGARPLGFYIDGLRVKPLDAADAGGSGKVSKPFSKC